MALVLDTSKIHFRIIIILSAGLSSLDGEELLSERVEIVVGQG